MRVSAGTVEILLDGRRVASHARSIQRGRHTTTAEHMPVASAPGWVSTSSLGRHQLGPQTRALAEAILADRPHPEQGYRSCLGILRLGKRYGDARLEAACARAVM